MLQIFKNVQLLRCQASKQISNQFVRNFAKDSSHKTHAALHEREKMRFTKKEANVRIVEELYFPDHSTLKINEFIQEKREEQVAKNPTAQNLGKVELSAEDMKYIESLSSQGVNEEVKSKSFFFPENEEEMSKLIAHTDINDKLLKFYMKHHRQCRKQQIFELLAKLEENLQKEDEVRNKEIEKHKAKTRKLQEINPDIEVKFGAVFLTREEILKHNGFHFLIRNINFKAEKAIYQPHTIFELYHSLLKFDPRCYEQIDPVFLKMFEKNIDKESIFTIAKFINFLQHYGDVDMPFKQAKGYMKLAANALNRKDFKKITQKEILAIIIPLKKIGIIPDELLMFRLEPYILKYLKELEPNKLAEIYTTYLRFRQGSSAFMDFLINALLLNLKKINLSYVKTIMTMSFPKLTYRSDLPYHELRRRAAKELMKKIKIWDLTNSDLLEVTRAFVVAGIGEENYYEMLSVEFMKRISTLEPAAFVEIYNLLAISGIKSDALVYGCNRKLEDFLNEMQETFRAEIKGLLETGEVKIDEGEAENEVLPKEVKLNIYEKKFVQEFTQLLKALWSHSFFIVKSKKWEFVDIDLWNRGVKELNDMIKKIKGFGGLVPFSRVKMEMLYQMNHFSRIHGKHSLNVNIQGLDDANLIFSDVKDPQPLPQEVKLFLLEKKYFMKKYGSLIAKFPKNKDYQYKFDLQNKTKGTVAHIFVNSAVDFLDSFNPKDIRSKGYLETRRHFLELLNVQYIEIGFDKFIKEIYNVRTMKGGYFEEFLKKHLEMPEVEALEEDESQELETLWERIKELRAKIPETSLALEQEFTMELQEKKLGDYFKDLEEGKVQEKAQEIEDEDVYIDSESDDETLLESKK